MSDTPRTDAMEFTMGEPGRIELVVNSGFARELERELAAAKEAAAAEFCRLNRDVTRQTEIAEKHRQRANELEEQLREMSEQCQSWADSSRAWKARADKNWRELDFSEKTGRQIWDANERLKSELERLEATLEDPAEVELAMIRGDIAIPHRAEFDGIRDTPPSSPRWKPTATLRTGSAGAEVPR